ncbi:MAG: hypothetical protein DA408_16530 [Bacteroidetes bacterium]|nr:MAG: hypothetical protein C7N36_00065 [Bacteroidota bacterium]PTM10243.1 MAG: hypothetical protein DA408_16530 [Bacteroidota bacterium]
MEKHTSSQVGIDDLAAYIPQLYLPIESLAAARGIEYAKLNKGLGLTAMAVPDAGEDAATMMANAVRELLEKNALSPSQIGRLYLGTESAIDGAKPTATYALQMLTAYFAPRYGADCFLNCDVVDLTFACIGAVDALQNTLDWVRADQERIGIVVASDNAKYELDSTGEYTQGAGAVAVLVRHQPRLLALGAHWGVSTRAVYDFYKPLRKVKKGDLIAEALHLANRNHVDIDQLVHQLAHQGLGVNGVLDSNEQELTLHKDTPIFDGPYSNDCYQERIAEALAHFCRQTATTAAVVNTWDQLLFHLPYAYQARRMFGEVFWRASQGTPLAAQLQEQVGLPEPQAADFPAAEDLTQARAGFWRAVTKTPLYQELVQTRIEPSERASSLVGNMYTGSILLALMSALETGLQAGTLAAGQQLGFFAYGSGSKSKVFTGTLQAGWANVTQRFQLFHRLQHRQPLDYAAYEQLHRQARTTPLAPSADRFYQTAIDAQGVRSYHIPQTQQAS